MKTRLLTAVVYPVILIIGLIAYLYSTAPTPLPDGVPHEQASISVDQLFRALASENNEIRGTFTREIVGEGEKHGLIFDEGWRQPNIVAGPLPALFLRSISRKMARNNTEVGLFLGSDFPIEQSNSFTQTQQEKFERLKRTGQTFPYFDESTKLYTAMFPDYATATACVSCHNQHPDSPRTDWKIGDMMGATTWTFPRRFVSAREALNLIQEFRGAAGSTWNEYLNEVADLTEAPTIGSQWPKDGYFLPDAETFIENCAQRSGSKTLEHLLKQP